MNVSYAVKMWPSLRSRANMLGSPAMAGNPVYSGSWLEQFMAKMSNQTDFVAIHWYKGKNATRFQTDVLSVCNNFKKPVWVTEFAPQTAGDAKQYPNQYLQAVVTSFMKTVTSWMKNNPCVLRFAWHDAREGTSALYNGTGMYSTLSETMKAYAEVN